MAKQHHFWILRRRRGSLAIPTLHEEVARVYRERGWEVRELPVEPLTKERRVLGAGSRR